MIIGFVMLVKTYPVASLLSFEREGARSAERGAGVAAYYKS